MAKLGLADDFTLDRPRSSMRIPSLGVWAALACLGMVGIAHGQGALSPEEHSLVRYIDQHNQEAIELLKRVVNVNSGTENFAGVRQVGAIFRAEFDALGFQTRWVDGALWNRAGHLVADHSSAGLSPGGGGPRLLLIGHLD